MKRWFPAKRVPWLLAGGLIIGLFLVFPPFHVVSLEESRNRLNSGVFEPRAFARQFWQNQLGAALQDAYEAQELIAAIRKDSAAAKARYGRVVGLGGPCHFLVKGTGTITAIDNRRIEVSLDEDNSAEIFILTSMIFGNEVLDATHIIRRSQFQKTNDYNAVSAEINRMVEKEIAAPFLQEAQVGDTVHFIGCSTGLTDEDTLIPLRLVPVKLEGQE